MSNSAQLKKGKWISVSAPGGLAQHIAVDCFDQRELVWKRVGTFSDSQTAAREEAKLAKRGLLARTVTQSHCPSTF